MSAFFWRMQVSIVNSDFQGILTHVCTEAGSQKRDKKYEIFVVKYWQWK